MSKTEILCTPYGEMLDMINCGAIYEGGAEQKINTQISDLDFILFEM